MVLLFYSRLLFSIKIHPRATAIKPDGLSGWKVDVVNISSFIDKLGVNRKMSKLSFDHNDFDPYPRQERPE